jgi:UDP-N-acetylbacillosamine alanyltransferase
MLTDIALRATSSARLLWLDDAEDVHLWDALVSSAPVPDVYYRPGYLSSYQAATHGQAVALWVEAEGVQALFPLLLQPVCNLPFASEAGDYDAATPYGYGGLLILTDTQRPNAEQVRELLKTLQEWCRENRLISVMLRLHPVLRQGEWLVDSLEDEYRLHRLGLTTALDLSLWNETTDSIATLNKGRRSDLSFARRHLDISWASERDVFAEDLHRFYELYEHRMDQLHVRDFYHFPWDYYTALANGLGSGFDIALAWLGDEAVGAALIMFDQKMAHYHLSASNEEGRVHKATTLILNAAAARARSKGCQRLHLGGGAAGEDKLFAFKKSFGGEIFQYSFISLVSDRRRYEELSQQRITSPNLPPPRRNFFPGYRA